CVEYGRRYSLIAVAGGLSAVVEFRGEVSRVVGMQDGRSDVGVIEGPDNGSCSTIGRDDRRCAASYGDRGEGVSGCRWCSGIEFTVLHAERLQRQALSAHVNGAVEIGRLGEEGGARVEVLNVSVQAIDSIGAGAIFPEPIYVQNVQS